MSIWTKLRDRLQSKRQDEGGQAGALPASPAPLTAEEAAHLAFGTGEYDESSGRRIDANMTARYADDCFDEEFTTVRPQTPLSAEDIWDGEYTSPDEGSYWGGGEAYTPTPTPTPF